MNPAATNLFITALYYIVVGAIAFFSLFGIYVLIRYGRSIIFALVLSAVYALFFVELFQASLTTLHTLLS